MPDVNTQLTNTQTATLPSSPAVSPANPAVGQGFDQYVGTRLNSGGSTEFFNQQNGQGYANPQALATAVQPYAPNANASNIFDVLKQGYTPLNTQISKEVPAKSLENPTSPSDVNSLLQQNNSIAKQYAGSFAQTPELTQAAQDVNQSKATLRNFDTSLQGGIQNIMKQPIALEFQQGQESALNRDASFTRSSLANSLSAYSDNLSVLQQKQQALQQGLQAQMQNGQFNLNFAQQLQQNKQAQAELQYQHQQDAQKFSVQYNVKAPTYSVDGGKTIINTQTGKAYTNPQDFLNEFGFKSWSEVPQDFIQKQFITNDQKNADRSFGLQQNQFDFTKAQTNVDNQFRDKQFDYTKLSGNRSFGLEQQNANYNTSPSYQLSYNYNTGQQSVFNPKTGQVSDIGSGTGTPSISIPSNTLAGRNNNPGNLRYAGQAGASQGAGGFARFDSAESGYQALVNDVTGKMTGQNSHGLGPNSTLSQLINVYAPSSENNTGQYIQQATAALGVSANTPLSQINPAQLAQFIAKKESGTTIQAGQSASSSSNASSSGSFPNTPDGLAAQSIINEQSTISSLSNKSAGKGQPGQQQRVRDLINKTIPGFNFENAQINYQTNSTAQATNAGALGKIQNSQKTAETHIGELNNSFDNIKGKLTNHSFFGLGNYFNKQVFQANSNNPDFVSFNSNLGLVRGELAKVLGGGEATDASRAEASKTVPDNLGGQSLQAVIEKVRTLMSQKIKEYQNPVTSSHLPTGYDKPSSTPNITNGGTLSGFNFKIGQ
ncbi:MAG: hypothetical protein ACR2N3_17810 [Pyrinomonadaceae bacterium]